MKPKHDIISHLRRHRLLAGGMTQLELAEAAGVTRQTILSIERGSYNPSVGLALRLATLLGTTVEELFEHKVANHD